MAPHTMQVDFVLKMGRRRLPVELLKAADLVWSTGGDRLMSYGIASGKNMSCVGSCPYYCLWIARPD